MIKFWYGIYIYIYIIIIIRCMYGIFGREIIIYTWSYTVYIYGSGRHLK